MCRSTSSRARRLRAARRAATSETTASATATHRMTTPVTAMAARAFLLGIEGEQLKHMLGAFCPNILFPYVRETIDQLVIKCSFPALMLAPINFEALYQQSQAQQAAAPAAEETVQ